MQVETLVALHIQCVHNIKSVERYCILAYRRGERILQEAYLVVVDIHIREDVLQYGVEDVSRLEEVVYSR